LDIRGENGYDVKEEAFMIHRNRYAIFLTTTILIACVAAAGLSLDEITQDKWAQDLDFLAVELPKKHKNLFHNISETEFRTQIEEFQKKLPSMDQDEILVGLMKILASVGDSHTTLGYRPQKALPLMLYWFKDGIGILNTTAEYQDILHGKITAIAGMPIDHVVSTLSAVIPHENEAQVKNKMPNLLTDTLILRGMKLISSQETASLTVLTSSGKKITREMKPLSFSSKPEWLVDISDESDAPLYLKNRRLFYWYRILPESKTLFFKYNACQNIKGEPFIEFIQTLFDTADDKKIKRIVIDLRHNGGGNSGIFAPFLQELKKRPKFLHKGNIYVLIGRRTFSSAILNAIQLKNQTPAIFAGEPSGGKPNHYGEVKMFLLPQSKLPVTYSIKYFKVVENDPSSLTPDLLIESSFADYLDKVDPVLNCVLEKKLF
jgi:hypothetical protein